MKNRVNHYWRVLGSGICFVVFGLGTLMLSLAFLALIRFLPVARSIKQRWILVSVRNMSRCFVWLMQAFGLFRLQTNAFESLPAGGHLVICNHPTLIDVLLIAAHTDNLCCIVKTPLLRNPFTRSIVRLAGYISNQSDTLLDDAAHALAAGRNLLVFPEGTRNTLEHQLEFKRGAANIALFANCPIVPVVIEISPRLLQKGQRWYQMPQQVAQVAVTAYPAFDPCGKVDPERPITIQARQLNRFLEQFYRDRLAASDIENRPVIQTSDAALRLTRPAMSHSANLPQAGLETAARRSTRPPAGQSTG